MKSTKEILRKELMTAYRIAIVLTIMLTVALFVILFFVRKDYILTQCLALLKDAGADIGIVW